MKTWAITHQVKHTAVNSLLTILKTNIPDNVLPADARTLVKTPAKVQITHDDKMGGEYWHYGLQKVLTKVLMFSKNQSITKISLIVNIDGVPISKSSTSAFWPILVKIHEMDEIAHLSPTHDDGTAINSGLEFLDFRVCATENMVHFTTQTSKQN